MKEIIYQGTDMVKTFGETTILQGISLKLYKGDFTVIMAAAVSSGFISRTWKGRISLPRP